ncbi:Pentatricopeptide repeat-containing protein [Quillaja saponaria]|uniref:Pentatricopeptide repeat-containing protein n=1 Tax=Quillaja saponaria TaxID=32244 RepID=A0AAD7KXE2_QUISA|nr:Pentatricopeptide repeat-containing protein [Quillaja saponaria]KAJ7947334.1 Pentatricopeptide repeat-containing protein [Quillaja saponaria]
MPFSTSPFIPRGFFISEIQKFIPKAWKQGTNQFDKPSVPGDEFIGSLLTSLKGFVSRNHLLNAFKTFSLIQHHTSSSSSFDHILHAFDSLLLACIKHKLLSQGRQLHAQTILLGFERHPVLVPRLITLYSSLDRLVDACIVTEISSLLHPLPWNLLISSYVRNGHFADALSTYKEMLSKRVRPDNFTYPSVLKACGEKSDLGFGREIHESIEASSLEWSLVVHNALVSMYGRFGEIEIARQLFDKMPTRDAVSWNTMISSYASKGMWEEAFRLFDSMQEEGIELNIITWNTITGGCLRTRNFIGALELLSLMRTSVNHLDSIAVVNGLSACSHIGATKLGKEIHGYAIRANPDGFGKIENALITMYSRCKDLRHACILFSQIKDKCIVTWNSMLSAFTQMDLSKEASLLFKEMLHLGFEPNYVTLASILSLCARVANLQHGKEFHCYILKHQDLRYCLLLWNALVDMYAKSGKVLEAKRVFDSLRRRDEFTYTSMISGYGMKGDGQAALKLFEEMQQFQIKPDHVTMVAVLSACSHSGLVTQGQLLFKNMSGVYGVIPRLEHYACMVDLFGRAGLLNKVKEIITAMPYRPTTAMWATLIRVCQINGNTEIGEWAARKLFEMHPEHSGYYANVYAAAGCSNELAHVRTFMRDLAVRNAPGCAGVDVGNGFSPFLVGDTSNPDASEMHPFMDGLSELIKDVDDVGSEDFGSSDEDFEELKVQGNIY